MDIFQQIEDAVVRRSIPDVKRLTQDAIESNQSPTDILERGLIKGLQVIGNLYERQEIFVPELILVGMAMKEALTLLQPILEKGAVSGLGSVVIGTVEGDVHDVGKNIVSMMLSGAGFKVIDLGIDVSADRFVAAVKGDKPDILALSCLYTPTRLAMKDVIESLKEANLRDRVKVLVGGAPIDEKFARMIGADGYAMDAPSGVEKARSWLGR